MVMALALADERTDLAATVPGVRFRRFRGREDFEAMSAVTFACQEADGRDGRSVQALTAILELVMAGPELADGILLAEVDGFEGGVAQQVEAIAAIARANGATLVRVAADAALGPGRDVEEKVCRLLTAHPKRAAEWGLWGVKGGGTRADAPHMHLAAPGILFVRQ